jgi:PKD domain
VTNFAHPHSARTAPRAVALRILILATALLALCLATSAPAGALIAKVGTGASEDVVGLQPADEGAMFEGPFERFELFNAGTAKFEEVRAETPEPNNFNNKEGNAVVHSSAVYVIYWDPTYHYHDDWKEKIDEFVQRIGGASNSLDDPLAVDTQYTDKTNQPAYNRVTFRGAAEDYVAYPNSHCTDPRPLEEVKVVHTYQLGCLTDLQLREQLESYISLHNLPKGMNTIYYLLTPPGLTVCLNEETGVKAHCSDFERSKEEEAEDRYETASYENGFCSYHSDINPGKSPDGDTNTILYSVIPWTAGGLHDGDFTVKDQNQADYCQDGGFNAAENEENERTAPVQQEPNQNEHCPEAIGDGYCDVGLADLIINQISQEQQDVVTDPLLNAWHDPSGKEVADECRNYFAPVEGTYKANPKTEAGTLYNQAIEGGKYYLNDAFNLAALRLTYPGIPCIPGVDLLPKFTAPNPVNVNDIVSFDGMESMITLNSAFGFETSGSPDANYATYKWNFGDGSTEISGYAPGTAPCSEPWLSPCAASVYHSYAYGGTYNVTLTVTDVGGNTASVTEPITVVGPSAPSTSGSGGSGSSGSTGTTGTTGTTTPGSTPGTTPVTSAPENVPPPIARAAVLSRSLKSALGKGGLVVRYSVSEQVAGHIEVLLPRTIAKKLGITGETAVGLAAGTPAQVVIAKAFLVTTKGGGSVVHIQFSKRTVARLKKVHKVTLLLRLAVRNAASHVPTSTTVLDTVTLAG